MTEHAAYKDPHQKTGFTCQQAGPVSSLVKEFGGFSDRVDEKLSEYKEVLERLADGLGQIKVLTDRDARREKDMEYLFERVRSLENNCRMEPRLNRAETDINKALIKMEGLMVKVGIIVAVIAFVGAAVGQLVIKRFDNIPQKVQVQIQARQSAGG